jgi:hypothetical protein
LDPARKPALFKEGDGMCQRCPKIGNLKHYINCCTNKLTSYTYRHDNAEKIVAQTIDYHNPQDIIKSETGNLLNRFQEIKLPEEIRSAEKNIEIELVPKEEEGKKKDPIYGFI